MFFVSFFMSRKVGRQLRADRDALLHRGVEQLRARHRGRGRRLRHGARRGVRRGHRPARRGAGAHRPRERRAAAAGPLLPGRGVRARGACATASATSRRRRPAEAGVSAAAGRREAEELRKLAPRHVLFLCVANSARSQMAEGIARSLAPPGVTVSSAGSQPSREPARDPGARRDRDRHPLPTRSKSVDGISPEGVDAVITLCAEEVCPVFLGQGAPRPLGPAGSRGRRGNRGRAAPGVPERARRAAAAPRRRLRPLNLEKNFMPKVQVFDPPMCCSTGVCGPEVDPALVRFAADLEWLKANGVEVERFNLSQEPAAFVGNPVVAQAIRGRDDGLPLLLVDGKIVAQGSYPAREVLAELAGSPRRRASSARRSRSSSPSARPSPRTASRASGSTSTRPASSACRRRTWRARSRRRRW